MPPGPLYNWLAVAHSALVILDHALQYRAAQATRAGSIRVSQSRQRGARGDVYAKTREDSEVTVKDVEEIVPSTADEPLSSEPTHVQPSSLLYANEAWLRQLEIAATPRASLSETVSEQELRGETTVASMLLEQSSSSTTVPGIAETRPRTAEPPTHTSDVALSISDTPSPEHLPIPEPEPDTLRLTPANDVCPHQPSQFFYIF